MMSSMSQRQIAAGFIVLAPIFSLGCQHFAKAVPTPERPSICEIRDNPDLYLGRNVEIVATYKSDSSFYSFFEDATCREKKNTLTITNRRIYESGDKSVIELVRKGRQICEGHATVCPVSAAVTLQGVIERDEEGVLGINVKRVLSYSY